MGKACGDAAAEQRRQACSEDSPLTSSSCAKACARLVALRLRSDLQLNLEAAKMKPRPIRVAQSWWMPPLCVPRPHEVELALRFWHGALTLKGYNLLQPPTQLRPEEASLD